MSILLFEALVFFFSEVVSKLAKESKFWMGFEFKVKTFEFVFK